MAGRGGSQACFVFISLLLFLPRSESIVFQTAETAGDGTKGIFGSNVNLFRGRLMAFVLSPSARSKSWNAISALEFSQHTVGSPSERL